MSKYTMGFQEISAEMVEQCGGKGAHLGELTKAGFNVPSGFCVISDAYFFLLKYNNLEPVIAEIARSIDFNNMGDIEVKTKKIRELIINSKLPADLAEIPRSYLELAIGNETEPYVAVRSSVAVKGTDISSFPGMMDTYHYIRGADEVLGKVKECWASVWTARAAAMRHRKGIDHSLAIIAPIVQHMVDPDAAGVVFTANPMTGSPNEIVIESNWGLGESVVSGKAMCDFFVLDKLTLQVKASKISRKNIRMGMDKEAAGGRKEYHIEPEKSQQPSLTEQQLIELGSTAKAIENHYGSPRDIEWAYEKDTLYILQARKIQGFSMEAQANQISKCI